jgi:hypothetical protein
MPGDKLQRDDATHRITDNKRPSCIQLIEQQNDVLNPL